MPSAAWQAAVRVSGAAVAATGEATTFLGGRRYQVTNTGRRIIDPAVAVVVRDNGTPVAAANILAIDFLFGVVEFQAAYTVTGPVTLDFSWLPTYQVGECRSGSFGLNAELVDASVFETQWRKRQPTLLDFEGTLQSLQLPVVDIDTVTAGTQSIDGWLKAGTPRLLDVLFASGQRMRAWVLFSGHSIQGEVAGIVTVDVSFQGHSPAAGAAVVAFGA